MAIKTSNQIPAGSITYVDAILELAQIALRADSMVEVGVKFTLEIDLPYDKRIYHNGKCIDGGSRLFKAILYAISEDYTPADFAAGLLEVVGTMIAQQLEELAAELLFDALAYHFKQRLAFERFMMRMEAELGGWEE